MGRELAGDRQISFTEVQHHHAHIASCLAENQIPLDTRPVLGIALDGLGFGPDGTLWGGDSSGSTISASSGWRICRRSPCQVAPRPSASPAQRLCSLDAAIGWDEVRRARRRLDVVRFLEAKPLAALDAMMRKSLNCPLSTSCGRLFDAVAAILGICREAVTYEGQAAIELECLVDAPALAAAAGFASISAPRCSRPSGRRCSMISSTACPLLSLRSVSIAVLATPSSICAIVVRDGRRQARAHRRPVRWLVPKQDAAGASERRLARSRLDRAHAPAGAGE